MARLLEIFGGGWGAGELHLFEQELQFGFRLGIAGEAEFASVSGRQVDVDHLDGGELLERAARGERRRQGVEAELQGDVEAIGEERDEDVRLDTALFFMEDWADGEVVLEGLEGFLDHDELDVVLPEQRGSSSAMLVRRR